MANYQDYLARFQLKEARRAQIPILEAAAGGKDVLAVMPTGGGKSLCFQLPSLMEDGITLVISPLLALMRDQTSKLRTLGIPAFHISSAQSDDENYEQLSGLRAQGQGLFYISPEQLVKASLQYALRDVNIARLVVDEAHCFSEWGHDFRPDYRAISDFLERNPGARLSAFTATATQAVVDDLRTHLFRGRAPEIFVTPPERKNIAIEFIKKEQPRAQLLSLLRDEPTIIYAATRSKTQVLAQALREAGWPAEHYHAGLETQERRDIEERFLGGDIRMIVATNAFGMGLDHASLRHIIHADMPASLEAYVQEIGRAGRDGKPARASALFGQDDYDIRREQIETSSQNAARRAQSVARLDALLELASRNGGWDEINQYFLENAQGAPENQSEETADWASPILTLKRWRYCAAQARKTAPFRILPDEILERIAQANPKDIDQLAAIEGIGEYRLQSFGDELLEVLGHLPTQTGRARQRLALKGQGALFERLSERARDLRYGMSGQDKPMDCPTSVITRVADVSPLDHAGLARVRGMSEERLARFGDAFLLEIREHNG